jgi:hypothetical protein
MEPTDGTEGGQSVAGLFSTTSVLRTLSPIIYDGTDAYAITPVPDK